MQKKIPDWIYVAPEQVEPPAPRRKPLTSWLIAGVVCLCWWFWFFDRAWICLAGTWPRVCDGRVIADG